MASRKTCIRCGTLSPENKGESTLTTSLGWRIRRVVGPKGEVTYEWRCPECWREMKNEAEPSSSSATSVPAPLARGRR